MTKAALKTHRRDRAETRRSLPVTGSVHDMSIISRPSRRGLSPLAGNAIRRLKSGRHSASRCGFALRLPRVHHSPAQCQLSGVSFQLFVGSVSNRVAISLYAISFPRSALSLQLSAFRGTINQCFASATSYLLLSSLPPAALAAENNIPFRPEMDLPAVGASQPVIRHLYLRKGICFRR